MADRAGDVVLRPMRHEDTLEAATGGSLLVPVRPSGQVPDWLSVLAHLRSTDPGGCWVAEIEGERVGLVASFRRELTWGVAGWSVAPGHEQVTGVLLDRAASYGRGCLRAMARIPQDPATLAHWRSAGFELHPLMVLRGQVDHSVLPDHTRVRAGDLGDLDLMDSVDRRARGSAHGPDHRLLATTHRLLVLDRPSGQGYAWVRPDGSPGVVAATSRAAARSLLWEVLAGAPLGATVELGGVSAANQWALEVGTEAGLQIGQGDYLAVRGMKPPTPYVAHPTLL